ncbi:TerC family protein [Bacillus sp. FJAT-47783]|uniref:TerC family protein n=1 Tax=Bacillus sp. FJAT-47783 TaxID=2922712 RepID=UPI001FACA790|nr:TerC family protein [Bacillus sp. FJAT-47783]
MTFWTPDFLSSLMSIIIIDLVLAGDNAIVIGLAARNLPKDQQKKAVVWGTAGAIIIRTIATLAVVWLLQIPGLLFIGGILLIWIAFKLMQGEDTHNIKSGPSFWSAIKTIVVADALMGLDNVLAVAGAAHGSFALVVIGLLVSIPIVIWGSTLILKWIERYPIIITIGAGVIAYTASKMIMDEPFLKLYFEQNEWMKWILSFIIIAAVIYFGRYSKQKEVPTASS